MIQETKQCQVCQRECHVLRCQQCRAAWYCSVDCQRIDWKKQHRTICSSSSKGNSKKNEVTTTQQSSITTTRPPVQVQQAWEELVNILDGKPSTELYQEYTLGNEVLRNIDESNKKNTNSIPNTTKQKEIESSNHTVKLLKSIPDKSKDVIHQHVLPPSNTIPQPTMNKNKYWDIYIEEMSNIFCYQILLRPSLRTTTTQKLIIDNLKFKIGNTDPYERRNNKSKTIYFCYHQLQNCPQPPEEICIIFPRSIIPNTHSVSLVDNNEAISIRLSYDMTDKKSVYDDIRQFDLLLPSQVQWIRCRNCCNKLFPSKTTATTTTDECSIKQILPLPSGQFDEMEDYLMCYDGQPAVEFNVVSSAAKKGILFEDETVLVVHQSDIPDTVCVLAQTGYGEEEESYNLVFNQEIREHENGINDEKKTPSENWGAFVRGIRPWRDKVGGATVTCSLCASVLGYAPIDILGSYRLLKHRLEIQPTTFEVSSNPFPSIGTFIVHEMIRYAECTAIFSFQIIANQDTKIVKQSRSSSKCLYLRLLSWDSVICTDIDLRTNSKGIFEISKWYRSAKLIYEQAKIDTLVKVQDHLESNSIWKWAQTDWCCSPRKSTVETNSRGQEQNNNNDTKTKSSAPSLVRLYISQREWKELYAELEHSSKYFSNEVKEAIILTKTGLSTQGQRNVGLACIPLVSLR